MPSFDIVVNSDLHEADNAVSQAQRELSQRFDFKGSKSEIQWDKKGEIVLVADDEYKLQAMIDMVLSKMVKRNLSVRNLDYGKRDAAFQGGIRQHIKLQQGIPQDKAKDLIKALKDSGLKVQASIQDNQVRVNGKKKDDLQDAIAAVRGLDLGIDFAYENFRD